MISPFLQKVAIFGSRGNMGGFFMDRFLNIGLDVYGFDLPMDINLLCRVIPTVDLVLLAVPIPAMDACLAAISRLLKPTTILADLCSVKTLPVKKMLQAFSGPVVGTHPLFGPQPRDEELRMAICPARDPLAAERLEEVCAMCSLTTFRTDPTRHDKAMAFIQGLNYVGTLAYFCAQDQEDGLRQFITPSFARRMEAARKMVVQDGPLFAALCDNNPFMAAAIRKHLKMLGLAAAGDYELLRDKALHWWQ
ncbi:prephenate dehydrogenase/arogenate dehydrogenase family protein [Desulfoplanes formicivorans]|uniref:Prephenate dehydrogenase n=1 Tax=Desulfoplanes formicivorans TaxID=1592317 RepID=A0A194AGK0_9BACT|nr:prephenate dehydrogenase/arogenate dehydrogenase family protein [Desulfoplanes formicivorans]GAU08453.1 prephenate dehydrogenase [Desulfoplanes formicivorans]